MSLSPQDLLSAEGREKCIENLKILPVFTSEDEKPKLNAAVLVPLCVQNNEVHLLYTLRSPNLRKHSGQVSFPGGKMDGNETTTDTALRETEEEIGFPRSDVEVWYKMPSFYTNNKKEMCLTPVVGVLKNFDMNNLTANADEVEEIFTVSMQALCDVNNHAYLIDEDVIAPIYYSGKYKIWGITGFITHLFLQAFLPNIYHPNFTRKQYKLEELQPSKI
ncbi:nucleoside diphosphate-linked moiety X motif 8 [Aricia agestis]|uniref:nucleoside diphosphate-linked moiety X motif 8 n=1 Tax=Aricia agestis TaxID=91739 RepID=UPI001C20A889|nr:nucleoside diphosphate-linked moiety X motif 8 [Aricia agestis]